MSSDHRENAFDLREAIEALKATPATLNALLGQLPDSWLEFTEDHEAWSPRSVLIHYIHNERTNWMPRAKVILSDKGDRAFAPFNQMPEPTDYPPGEIDELLDLFAALRSENLDALGEFDIQADDLDRTGEHPSLGTVNLRQLLSTWVVHDYNHLHQIVKTLAKQYDVEVGPWKKFLGVLEI